MRKLWIPLICMVLVVSCEARTESSSFTDSLNDILIPSSISSTVSTPSESIPAMVDISTMAVPLTPPILPIGEAIELQYMIERPQERFLNALSKMSDEHYTQLLDKDNFFEIGEMVTDYNNKSVTGYGEIVIDYQDGTYQQIFSSLQPIGDLSFLSESRKLMVALAETVQTEVYECSYYTINLDTLELSAVENTVVTLPVEMYYQGCRYRIKSSYSEPNFYSIFRFESGYEEEPIIDNVLQYQFFDGKIYFLDENGCDVLSVGLDGSDKRIIYSSLVPFRSFEMMDGYIVCWTESTLFIVNLDDLIEQIVLDSPADVKDLSNHMRLIYQIGTGFYVAYNYDDSKDAFLDFVDYEGNVRHVLSNFRVGSAEWNLAVIGDWIYFTTTNNDNFSRTLPWKVRLDGSELTLLSYMFE